MNNNASNQVILGDLSISPYQISEVYPKFDLRSGVDLNRLGSVMLDLHPLQIMQYVPEGEADLYTAKDERFWYVAGVVGESEPHVTLKFGLLKPATEWREEIDYALTGWSPEPVTVSEVSYFESPPGVADSWYCIVGKLKLTRNLLEGNVRLSRLPHIDMHPTYKPHVTFAFIKKDPALRDKWIDCLMEKFTGTVLTVRERLNYSK